MTRLKMRKLWLRASRTEMMINWAGLLATGIRVGMIFAGAATLVLLAKWASKFD